MKSAVNESLVYVRVLFGFRNSEQNKTCLIRRSSLKGFKFRAKVLEN